MSAITIVSNPVKSKLMNADHEAKALISKAISYPDVRPNWTGTVSMFEWIDSTFPTGFLAVVYKTLKSAGYSPVVVRDKAPKPLGEPIRECVVSEFGFSDEYWYQPRTVELLVKHRSIIAMLVTGAGKSVIAKLAYKHIGRKTLFLTTRSVLFHQMADSVKKDMGESVGYMGDNRWEPIDGFNVGMVKTLSEGLLKMDYDDEIIRYMENREQSEGKKAQKYLQSLKDDDLSPYMRGKMVKEFRASMVAKRKKDKDIEDQIKTKVKKHNGKEKGGH